MATAAKITEPTQTQPQIAERTLADTVPVGQMFVDQGYARDLKPGHLKRILSEINVNGFGVILLSLRDDGRFAILDGQHRWEAAKILGVKEMIARVYIDLTYEEEAALYTIFARHMAQSTMDRFKAGVEAGDPTCTAVAIAAARLGLKVTKDPGDGNIQSVGKMIQIYERYGQEMLEIVLKTLYAAFGRKQSAYQAPMLWGVAVFTLRFVEHADWVRVVARLKAEGVLSLTQRAQMLRQSINPGGQRDVSMGQVIHSVYNLRSRTPIPEWYEVHGGGRSNDLAQLPSIMTPEIRLRMRKAFVDVPNYPVLAIGHHVAEAS